MSDAFAHVFVGRERELAAMEATLASVEEGRCRLLLVVGEPGIGKSTLVDRFADGAARRGARVLWGTAWEHGGAPSYWPWVQVLRPLAAEIDRAALPAHDLAALGRLIPEVSPEGRPRSDGEGESERFAVFDVVARTLESASRATPLVVIIEDLHAAGLPSALLLRFLAQHIRGAPVMLVATYRDVEARLNPELGRPIAELEAMSDVLALPSMSDAEVRDVVTFVLPDASGDLVAAIGQRAQGNPLFVTQLTRLLRAGSGALDASDVPIPDGIRRAVHQRLERLAEPDSLLRSALTVSSVLGREIAVDEVADVLDTPVSDLLGALEPAFLPGLLVEIDRYRYRFAHALVRDAIYDDLDSKERATLHQRTAEVLEADPLAAAGHARLAHHFLAAVPVGGADGAVRHATAAGQEALAALAHEEAIGHFKQALAALHHTHGDTTEKRCELLLLLGTALVRAGNLGQAEPVLVQATEHARRCDNGDLLARAALLRSKHLAYNVIDHDSIALLEEASRRLDGADTPILARVYSQLAIANWHSKPGPMAAAADRAVDIARRCGDRTALAAAMATRLHARWGHDEPSTALTQARELARLADQAGDDELAVTAQDWLMIYSLQLGNLAEAQSAQRRMTTRAEGSRQPVLRYMATSRAATLAALTGRFDDALTAADDALEIGTAARVPDADAVHSGQLFSIWRLNGLPAEHEERFERRWREVAAEGEWSAAHHAALAMIELAHGSRTAATARFESAVETVPQIPLDGLYVWALALLTECAKALAHTSHADELYSALLPYSGRFVAASSVMCLGAVDHQLATLATLAGRLDDAARHFESAIAQHRRAGLAPMIARSSEQFAEMLRARGGPGDEQRANELLAQLGEAPPGPPSGAGGRPDSKATETECRFRRSGRTWQLQWNGESATVPDSKGMRDLAVLLAAPGRDISVLDLVEAAGGPSSAWAGANAGEQLDRTAREAYRQRLEELNAELAEAEEHADVGRLESRRREHEFLAAELAGAMGLAGRPRTMGDPVERARKAVTNRIRTALKGIDEVIPSLALHLDRSVTTGRWCAYRPERPVRWHL